MAGTAVQHRRGTAAQWAAANPVLPDGELGYEKDTGIVKVGNGTTTWNQLQPILVSQFLPVAGKAADSERLDGLDSTAFAQKNYIDDRVAPAGTLRTLVTHFGYVTEFPTTGVKVGDRCYRSDAFCDMTLVTTGIWRQTAPAHGTKAQRLTIDTTADATPINTALYTGFEFYEADTDRTWRWTGTKWRYIGGGVTPFIKVKRGSTANTAGNGWNPVGWDGTVHPDTTDTSMLQTVNGTKFFAPIDGLYLINWAGSMYSATATITAYAGARKNGEAGQGAIVRGTSATVPAGGSSGEVSCQATFRLAAGEYVEAMTYGLAAVASQAEFGSRCEVLWVGNY